MSRNEESAVYKYTCDASGCNYQGLNCIPLVHETFLLFRFS